MGFLDTLLGRSKPVRPDLDRLFALPTAALTLDAGAGFTPTGTGSVCFRAAEGRAFADVETEVRELLDAGNSSPVTVTGDDYGYTWLVARRDPSDISGLATDIHAVNSSLEANGFGPLLLCSLVAFTDSQNRKMALVYLFKRGTFYPFCPLPGERRDTALELQIRSAVGADLPIEKELERWFPVWGAPGL